MKNYLKMILIASSISGLVCGANDIERVDARTIQKVQEDARKLYSKIPELYNTLEQQSYMKNVITAAYEKYKQNPNLSLIESKYDSYDFLYKESTKNYEEAIRDCDEQIETIAQQILDKEKEYGILVNYLHSNREVIRQQEKKAKQDRDAELLNTNVTEQSEIASYNNNEDADEDWSSESSSSWSDLSLADNNGQPFYEALEDEDESQSKEDEEIASPLQEEEIVPILQEQRPANRRGWFSRFLNFFHRQPAVEQHSITTSIEE